MYNFVDTTAGSASSSALPAEALQINGAYIENEIGIPHPVCPWSGADGGGNHGTADWADGRLRVPEQPNRIPEYYGGISAAD